MSALDWILVAAIWCIPAVLILIARIRKQAKKHDEDDFR